MELLAPAPFSSIYVRPWPIYSMRSQPELANPSYEDLPWMARLLAGVGIPFVIRHPPELRDAVLLYGITLAGYAQQIHE